MLSCEAEVRCEVRMSSPLPAGFTVVVGWLGGGTCRLQRVMSLAFLTSCGHLTEWTLIPFNQLCTIFGNTIIYSHYMGENIKHTLVTCDNDS